MLTLGDVGHIAWNHASYPEWFDDVYNELIANQTLLCFDSANSIRKDEFPYYKENRVASKEGDMYEQVLKFKLYLIEETAMQHVLMDGLEADDLIAIICNLVNPLKVKVFGIDKDLLQISNMVMQKTKGEPVQLSQFSRKQPKTIRDLVKKHSDVLRVLVIHGDVSDNIFPIGKGRLFLEDIARMWYEENFYQTLYQNYGEVVKDNLKLAMLPHYSVWENEFTLDYVDAVCNDSEKLELNQQTIESIMESLA